MKCEYIANNLQNYNNKAILIMQLTKDAKAA